MRERLRTICSLPALSQRRRAMTTRSSSPTRRNVLATMASATALALAVAFVQVSQAATSPATPEGPGSASGAPHLPKGFTDTFTSRYISSSPTTCRLSSFPALATGSPSRLPTSWSRPWPSSWRSIATDRTRRGERETDRSWIVEAAGVEPAPPQNVNSLMVRDFSS